MKHTLTLFNCRWLIIFCLLFSQSLVTQAEDRLLESINVDSSRDDSVIDLRLNQQVNVISHSPLQRGDLLRLNVRRTGSTSQIDEPSPIFESLPWHPTPQLPLFEVTVDLEGAILFHFKRSVTFERLPATNSFHIRIRVLHPVRKTELPEAIAEQTGSESTEEASTDHADIDQTEDPVLAGLLDEAKKAMLNQDYRRAIQLYTKVRLQSENSVYGKQALEFLGLARERNKQFAHAKVVYEKYLKLYPRGEDAERVSQRLTGILTAQTEPREELKKGDSKKENRVGVQWDTFGSISQFYNRNESKFNTDQTRLNRSSLQNGLDFTSRLSYEDFQAGLRFSGTYNANVETDDDDDEKRISSFYLDLIHQRADIQLRLGRQSPSSGGILGRFDGGHLSIPVYENIKLNLVGGFSVLSSSDIFVNTDQYFYGINADFGTYLNAWDFNAFFIEQRNHSVLDRRAVGGEVRFFDEDKSFFTFFDYDIFHDELNTFLFTGQWIFDDRTTVNLSYDYRTSPFLTTQNATQGQSVDNLDALLALFSLDQIKTLAKDRTAISQTGSLSLSRPLSDNFQLNADFRLSTLSATVASGGVDKTEGTGLEYSIASDITGSNLLTDGDIYVVGARYNILQNADSLSININARYPITRDLRINPRVRFNLRMNDDGTENYGYQPSIRLTYRVVKGLQLELEGGGDWLFQERNDDALAAAALAGDTNDFDETRGYFFIAGYRYNF